MQTRGSRRVPSGGVIWSVLCVFAASVAVALVAQSQGTERLRREVAEEGQRLGNQTEMLRFKGSAQMDDAINAELERLRGDRAALERLRREVGSLRKSIAGMRSIPVRKSKDVDAPLDITEELVASNTWRNMGHETPSAAVETVLWAAAGGDTDLLMKGFILEESA